MDAPKNEGPYRQDDDMLESYQQWFDSRPESVQRLVAQCPPFYCYRMAEDHPHFRSPGHYTIHSYSESGTLTIVHGSDSFLPGLSVIHVKPEHLTTCNCGLWEPATDAQIADTDAFMREEIARRDAARKQS